MGKEQELAILFADVVGSTQLYEALGDDAARETVQTCVDAMKQSTEKFGGSVIKTMGDEVMATFPSADDAMNAATQMQKVITNKPAMGTDDTRVAIRIGCHFGHVVVEDRDIFGAAVHTANRMTSQAKAGQIITTEVTVEQLSGDWKSLVRQIGVTTLRGQSDEVALFEVLWQPEEATSIMPEIDWNRDKPKVGQLTLQFQGREIVMPDGGAKGLTLGRGDDNDVTVKGNLISRLHARIELNRSRFMLIDESTNGTFILREDGEEIYVRRDSAELSGSGVIGLGRVAAPGTPLAIEFTYKV